MYTVTFYLCKYSVNLFSLIFFVCFRFNTYHLQAWSINSHNVSYIQYLKCIVGNVVSSCLCFPGKNKRVHKFEASTTNSEV